MAALLVRVAATSKPAGGHIAVVGAQLAGPRQGDGQGVAALGGYAVPVLAPADGHRVAHLGPLRVLEHAQVAAHGQGDRLQRRGAQAPLEAGHQAAVVQHVAVQPYLGARRIGDQGEGPVSLQVGQVPRAIDVVFGQGHQVVPEQGLGAGRVPLRGSVRKSVTVVSR